MTLDSRYTWTHQIKAVKKDIIDDVEYKRRRRVSITFRYIES